MDFAKSKVVQLIKQFGDVIHTGTHQGFDYWILKNLTTIRLPESHKRIPLAVVEMIALEQLCIGHIRFDYWLGEQ